MPLVIVGKETYEEKGFPAKPAAVFVPSNQSGCVLGMKKKQEHIQKVGCVNERTAAT